MSYRRRLQHCEDQAPFPKAWRSGRRTQCRDHRAGFCSGNARQSGLVFSRELAGGGKESVQIENMVEIMRKILYWRGMASETEAPAINTAAALLATLSRREQKIAVEKLREIVHAIDGDRRWDELLEKHPEPMLEMAAEAEKEIAAGRFEPMKF